MSVSILIPTLNEERNMAECLASVAWSDDVVVVDSGSRDKTCEIARAAGARVVEFKWNGQFPKKKNWALENVAWKHDWVFILDADERIMPELVAEIQAELKQPKADGYFITAVSSSLINGSGIAVIIRAGTSACSNIARRATRSCTALTLVPATTRCMSILSCAAPRRN